MWTHFHHEADIGVRGTGHSPEEAFEQAAVALTAVIPTYFPSRLPANVGGLSVRVSTLR